ncbi:MAG: putative FmdB family regulatory protein [Halioglobus sp.]|jgi:putative FmdB family regulatory protein
MPNYDYKCKKCDHSLTVFQKITEDKITKCPECLESSLLRLIGGANATLRFEGTGYYITDYGPKKNISAPSDSSSVPNSSTK